MRRLLLLIGCLVGGGAVAWIGSQVTGSQWWFLALPGAIAAGWLVVADPRQCTTPPRGRGGDGP